MKIEILKPGDSLRPIVTITEKAFSASADADISKWLDFDEIARLVSEGRGVCMRALGEEGEVVGAVYAQQESPVNGEEGREKWVVIILSVDPGLSNQGIGSQLMLSVEEEVLSRGAKKMFIYTNETDESVIRFYHKCGYQNAGRVQDYQFGKENSAVFLLKYLVS